MAKQFETAAAACGRAFRVLGSAAEADDAVRVRLAFGSSRTVTALRD